MSWPYSKIDPEKYTVFKTKDMFWGYRNPSHPEDGPRGAQVSQEHQLDGCFVIRLQDPFAAAALEAYAAAIEAGLNVLDLVDPRQSGAVGWGGTSAPTWDAEAHDYLMEVVMYAREMAERSRKMHHKLPD